MAWGAWLELPRTLLTPADVGVTFGASYTDVHARIPVPLGDASSCSLLGAGLALWHGFSRRGWPLAARRSRSTSRSRWPAASTRAFVQRFIVTPNEQDKEQPFIVHNIAATRRAYALDRVEERELSGDAELTPQDIIANAGDD